MTHKRQAQTLRALIAGSALCFGLGTVPAMAQLPTAAEQAATGQANPSRVQDQFQDGVDIPDLSPQVEVRNVLTQKVPAGAENMFLTLNSISFDGVSVYTAEDLGGVYADKLGQKISLADVYTIAAKLTNKYRNEGYVLTQVSVPPQTIASGNVKLKVTEGYIDSVSVEGTDDASAIELVQKYAAKLQTGGVLNTKDLERYLLLISDLPGMDARSVLDSIPNKPGAASLRILVSRDPYDALLSIDNFGSRYLGPVQTTAAGTLNSFFGHNEAITAQFVAAPISAELGYFSLGYKQPINDIGTTVELVGSHTATKPGYDLADFHVRGRSQFFSMKIEHPFVRSRAQNLYLHALLDWRNVESRNDVELTRRDRIRNLRVGGRYEFLDTLLGVGINSVGLELSRGLDIFGGSSKGDANLSRSAADPEAFKLTGEAQRLQRITSDINLLLSAKGQLASNPLLSSEEFGVGGYALGRAYDPSEIVGDDGVSGSIEVQWNKPVQWDFVQDYQLYGFFDAGRVWNDDATTSAQKIDSVTSTGLGIRADFMDETKAGLAIAFPLNRDVQTQKDRDPRFYLNLSRNF